MGVVDKKLDTFEQLVRLRRIARELPGNRDVAAVRAAIERDLGDTVSLRLAARALGVSHTALQRWIQSGDLPVVYAASGRTEVPVPALLDLRESVDSDRDAGARRYALTPTMTRHRTAAARMGTDLRDLTSGSHGHNRASARGLAYHRAVARRLRKPMVDEARHVLYRWREEGRIDERYADRWEQILNQPVREIRRRLVEKGSDADDLRQNSPFAGLLSEPERNRIIREVR